MQLGNKFNLIYNGGIERNVVEVTLQPLIAVVFSPLLIFAGLRSRIRGYGWDKIFDKK